ncbi:TPA: hypothetical protein N0F65_008564, partial [Lagenidium giganteum]
ELIDGDWPFASEIAQLQRLQHVSTAVDDKITKWTRALRASRFDPRKTRTKQLRVRVLHSYTPPVETGEGEAAVRTPGQWTLRLETVDGADSAAKPTSFSRYFRKVTFELAPHLYPEATVEWTCFQKTSNEVDGVELTRPGSDAHAVRIKLLPSATPERFTISPSLSKAIHEYLGDSMAHTKQDIVMATWEYIKRRNLIKEDDCRVVTCDPMLVALVGCESLPFASLVVALKSHLTPAGMVELTYELPLGAEACANKELGEHVFDVDVGLGDDLESARSRALADLDELQSMQKKELEMLQQQEHDILVQLHAACQKREWMMQFALDPVGFTQDVVQSQHADQEILTAESEADDTSFPNPHQFEQPWVPSVVSSMMVQAGMKK